MSVSAFVSTENEPIYIKEAPFNVAPQMRGGLSCPMDQPRISYLLFCVNTTN